MDGDAESLAVASNAAPWSPAALPCFSAVNASITTLEGSQLAPDSTNPDEQQQQQQRASTLPPSPPHTQRKLQPGHCKSDLDAALNVYKQRRLLMIDRGGGVSNFQCVPQRRRVSEYAGLAPSSRSSKHPLTALDSHLYQKRSGRKAEAVVAAAEGRSSARASVTSARTGGPPDARRESKSTAAKQEERRRRSSSHASHSRSPSELNSKQTSPPLPPPRTSESIENTHRAYDSNTQRGEQENAAAATRNSSVVVLRTREALSPTTPRAQLQQQQQQGTLSDAPSPLFHPQDVATRKAAAQRQISSPAESMSQALASTTKMGSESLPSRLPSFRRTNSRVTLHAVSDGRYSASKGKRRQTGSTAPSVKSSEDGLESSTGHRLIRRVSSLKTLSIVWAKRPYDPSSASHRALEQRRNQQQKLQKDRRDKRTQWKLTSPSRARRGSAAGTAGQRRLSSEGRESSQPYDDYSASGTDMFEESDDAKHNRRASPREEKTDEAMETHSDSLRRSLVAVLMRHGVATEHSPNRTLSLPYISASASSSILRSSPLESSATCPVGAANEGRRRSAADEGRAVGKHRGPRGHAKGGPAAQLPSSSTGRQPPSTAPPVRQYSVSGAARSKRYTPSMPPAAKVTRLPPLVASNSSSRRTSPAPVAPATNGERRPAGRDAKRNAQARTCENNVYGEVGKGARSGFSHKAAEQYPQEAAAEERRSIPPGYPAVAPPPQLSPPTQRSPYKIENAEAHHRAKEKLPPFIVSTRPLSRRPRPPRPPPQRKKQKSLDCHRISYTFAPYMAGMPYAPGGGVLYTPTTDMYSRRSLHKRRQVKQANKTKKLQRQYRTPSMKPIDYTALATQRDPLDYILDRHGFWGESTTR
ncbi:hypothetical protein ABL78_7658 [Leptomonas seymouri]|uniref:Uncharacterized protein n=1 Tax=Leptomonas seymouri TaxID=5684 RepID=A0A0N1P9Z9_LEPSE|nr:hypothetical protein ABL78_7658 [Leptomonas seymouri]|eukprot:KPI83308.1 hypothetical protein ABL78_7658 [Leptomonas seymouri]